MTAPATSPGLMDYDEAVATFDPVLGLEVHVELGTASKMFCGCDTTFGALPNSQVCPTCLGLPGSLPVLNRTAVESTIRVGLALGCDIAEWCRFARKNYFYPDMPKNFQTSQYDEPICTDGHLDVEVATDDGPRTFRVEIERVHMEEDTGKSLHVGGATGRIHGADYSLVDYNRAGIPLIEVVTKPVEGTGALVPQVARAYVTALRELMRTLGVSDVRMEQGSLRCDVNLSLRRSPTDPLGTRSETKNVNSLRSVERAVRHEVARQAALLTAGGRVVQETRHWHEDTGSTTSGRSKEQAEDYRYFPEPDLVPVAPDRAWVEELRAGLPASPAVRRAELQAAWGLSDADMRSLVNTGAVDLVESTVAAGAPADAARKWWLGELARHANERQVDLAALPISPEQVARVRGHRRVRGAQRQARPAGHRGRAGRRGRPRRGRRAPRPGRGQRRHRAARRRRRGAGREPRRRREGPRRQGGRRRCGRRSGHEGNPRPGRRRPGARAGAGALRPVLTARWSAVPAGSDT